MPRFEGEESIKGSRELSAYFSRNFCAMDTDLEDAGDEVKMGCRLVRAGPILISLFHTSGNKVRAISQRGWSRIRQDNAQLYQLCFPLDGEVVVSQEGRQAVCRSTQFSAFRMNAPWRGEAQQNDRCVHNSLYITMPFHLMRAALADANNAVAKNFSAESAGARLARDTFLRLYLQGDQLSAQAAEAYAIAGIQSASDAMRGQVGAIDTDRRYPTPKAERILNYINQHLADPDLTISKVARACGLCTRRVQAVLHDCGLTFRDHVWQERLVRAHSKLVDARFHDENIARIAFESGFKSNAHFTRSFRSKFGTTPTEARRRSMTEGVAAGAN